MNRREPIKEAPSRELTDSLQKVVDYLWSDEERDFEACPPDQRQGHVFASLRVVRRWLNERAAEANEHDFAGHCPRCGGNDGYFNLGRAHYSFCRLCRTKWMTGENLFSSWRAESAEDWEANQREYADYEEVEPVFDWPEAAAADDSAPEPLPRIRGRLDEQLVGVVDDGAPGVRDAGPKENTPRGHARLLAGLLAFAVLFFLPELLVFAEWLAACRLCCGG